MTQDEIIRFAIQCRLVSTHNREGLYMDALTEFAKLIAAKATASEREACAKVCDELVNEENSSDYQNAANWCSERIRARAGDKND
jgi:osmotically-inducible protein OsmY